MELFDYHAHTDYSFDAHVPMGTMIQGAVDRGIKELCLTDHVDFIFKDKPYPHQIDHDLYFRELDRCRELYADRIILKRGMEIGVNIYSAQTVEKTCAGHDLDFVIASTHDIEGIDLMNDEELYRGRTKKESYGRYFRNALSCVRNIDGFSVFGHLDFISRYGRYEDKSLDYDDFSDEIDAVLRAVIDKGKGIEVNTSGYRYGIGTTYPQPKIVRRYKELGGEIITVGSDAHRPEYLADHFGDAIGMIKAAGFDYICKFDKMKPVFVKIT